MNKIVKKITGMDNMTNQIIASDLLLDIKSSINIYAIALTETTTPEIRSVLRRHLNDTIVEYEKFTKYMIENDYYNPYDFNEQVQIDLNNSETALKLTKPS
jgi:similar to spore coat protein